MISEIDGALQEVDCDSDSSSSDGELPAADTAVSADIPSKTNVISATTKAASALLISASDKAGMAGIDRERINAILLRESGNSTFMQRQRKMDENSNRKIEEMRQRLEDKDSIATNDWRRETKQSTIEPLLQNYRMQRQPISTCVVIDMDGFFISCHILDHPHLALIPACVGGTSMISTSNYVARKYGVRAAMPGYIGSTLVEELSGGKEKLTFVKSDFGLYKIKSAEVRTVLEEYDQNLKMYSLDEAYMDIGPYLEMQLLDQELSHDDIRNNLLKNTTASQTVSKENKQQSTKEDGSPTEKIHDIFSLDTIHTAAQNLLHSIRQKVKDTTGLSCSAGLSSNFLLAKIASDMNKPDGQYFVGPSEDQILKFINPLQVRKVNGIGRVMEKTLRGVCGIETVQNLHDKRADVYFLFKPASAQFLMRACIGYAEGKHHESTEDEVGDTEESLQRKGISHERTFSPMSSWSDMCTKLEGIALSLVSDLKERELRPKTITLKVKLTNFDILSRATTRDVAMFQNCNYRQSSQDLVDIVILLLKDAKREHEQGGTANKKSKKNSKSVDEQPAPFSVRLLGVRCSNFQLEKDNQLSLDRYRTGGHIDDAIKASSLPQPTMEALAKSPSVKNPYTSPKPISTRGVVPVSEAKRSRSGSKRALYTSTTPTAKSDSANMPTETNAVKESSEQIQCPICSKTFNTGKHGNAEINAHIDSCLNASTVKELAKEETKCADERTKKKRRRLTDFFNS